MEGMVVELGFWKDKKVLLTGHTGFKGGWLCLWLQSLGADVTGFSLAPPTKTNLFEVANVEQGMRSIIGDIRDLNAVRKIVAESQPEIVIHMAAQSLVRKSYQDPVETYSTNVMGTVNLLDAIRHSKSIRAVVNVTSDKCYENKESAKPFTEADRMGGHDPYSNSKGCAELVAQAFTDSFFNAESYSERGVAVGSARAGNVIGGGDWADDRLIPDMFRAITNGDAVIIRSPKAIRPWQHVLEPLNGYLCLAQNLYEQGADFIGGWNFGPEDQDTQPVSWVVNEICQLWGNNAMWQLADAKQPYEAQTLMLDSSKSKSLLNWSPKWELAQTLEHTVAWTKAYKAKENMREFTLNQISKFRM
jgi:CDP-glucose 4,6-dehydratase